MEILLSMLGVVTGVICVGVGMILNKLDEIHKEIKKKIDKDWSKYER